MSDKNVMKNAIVLEGEAEYKKALGDINSQLRESKSAMKAAAAEYENAGDSMQAMYRYGDTLERTMESQNEALRLMSEHLTRVEACYGKNSREANDLRTKINNMRTELAKTQTQMRQFEGSMDAAADAGNDLRAGMDAGCAGLEQVGEAAGRAQGDVQELSQTIADMMGKKIIDFAVGKEMLSTLSDGLKWAMGEAMDGVNEWAHNRALTGDDAQTDRRMAMKDVVDRYWSGRRDGMQTVNDVAAVDTALSNLGITSDEQVIKLTNLAITLEEVFGQDVQSTIDRATAMVNTYGVSWETALDLMTKGMRDMSDGGAQMLEAFETYGQSYKQLGYDIDDMYSALAAAANDASLGKDSNLNKGVDNLIKNLTSGSKESKETLKALGAEITDLPGKFQQGGDAAAEAVQLILTKLQAVTDEAKRNDLGKALFGDTIWIESAGQIADVILAGYDQVVDASGATADAMMSELDNLGDSWSGLMERMSQQDGKIFDPLANDLNDFLRDWNMSTDAAGGDVIKGLGDTVANRIQDEGNRLMDATADLYAKLEALDDQIMDAWLSGDTYTALTLEEQKQQLIDEIAAVKQEVMDGFGEVGNEAATSLENKAEDMRSSAETLTGEAVGAVTDAQGDMSTAAGELGQSAVTGLEDGMEGMPGAAQDTVDATVSALGAGKSRAYNAGYATGKAFEDGYNDALDRHSPSRVMREAAQDTVSPLFDEFEQDRQRLYASAAALAQAVSDGYGEHASLRAQGAAGDAQDMGTGVSAAVLAEAVREALDGAGVYVDGKRMGELTAPGVSCAISRRAEATVRGMSAQAKRW